MREKKKKKKKSNVIAHPRHMYARFYYPAHIGIPIRFVGTAGTYESTGQSSVGEI